MCVFHVRIHHELYSGLHLVPGRRRYSNPEPQRDPRPQVCLQGGVTVHVPRFRYPLLFFLSKRYIDLICWNYSGNLFTPWFKLIARDFLFGWWDELYKRRSSDGKLVASSLAGVADGSKVIKMA